MENLELTGLAVVLVEELDHTRHGGKLDPLTLFSDTGDSLRLLYLDDGVLCLG